MQRLFVHHWLLVRTAVFILQESWIRRCPIVLLFCPRVVKVRLVPQFIDAVTRAEGAREARSACNLDGERRKYCQRSMSAIQVAVGRPQLHCRPLSMMLRSRRALHNRCRVYELGYSALRVIAS